MAQITTQSSDSPMPASFIPVETGRERLQHRRNFVFPDEKAVDKKGNIYYFVVEMIQVAVPGEEYILDSPAFLSTLELMVLHTIVQLGTNAYGVPIREEIYKQYGRDISVGALYVTLTRVENKGFLKSHMGDPTKQRGGRAKKYFVITALGQEVLVNTIFAMRKILVGTQFGGG